MNIVNANLKFRNLLKPLNIKNVRYIVIHHPEAITATPQDIHQWHIERGWSGGGYNEYIRKDGTVYILRGDNIGAQCDKYNSVSYGICCEGDYGKEQTMPQAQFNALVERCKFHLNRFSNCKVVGHGELNPTACPGKFFPLGMVKNAVNSKVVASPLTIEEALKIVSDKSGIDYSVWLQQSKQIKWLDSCFIKIAQAMKEV